MSSSTFRPHGLIKSPIEEVLYHRAHIANVHVGLADPKEHETSALMEVVLYSNIFTSHNNFIVNSQQPPTAVSDKKCDIVVRYLEQGTQKIRVLCFAECKRARTSQPFSLTALEEQARDYSILHLGSEPEMAFVYVATMAGAHIRLWMIHSGDHTELVPFWGSSSPGNWSEYKDVGDDEAGKHIEYWFEHMKQLPPTPHAGQTGHTYGTPSTANIASTQGYRASSSGYQASSAPASGYPASSSYQASLAPASRYPASSSYQVSSAPTSNYQASSAPASGYPASSSNYQVSLAPASGYPDSSSSYQASSALASDYHTGFPSQSRDSTMTGVEISEQLGEQSDEDDEDNEIEGSVKTREAAEYRVVKVNRIRHTFKSDEFVFKDKKGKTRSTVQNDWKRTVYGGQPAWKHHRYICTERLFY